MFLPKPTERASGNPPLTLVQAGERIADNGTARQKAVVSRVSGCPALGQADHRPLGRSLDFCLLGGGPKGGGKSGRPPGPRVPHCVL